MKPDAFWSSLRVRAIVPWLALAVLVAAVQAVPDSVVWMRYDRTAIGAGEWWRIVSSNFIHLGWGHLVLNVAGLLAIGWLFAEDYTRWQWAFVLLVCSVTSSVGLYLWNPEIEWCVGLSGALHGLFAAGALAWVRDGDRMGFGLLAGLGAKLGYEQFLGAMPFSEGVVGGSVVTDAHLYGALGGGAAAVALWWWRARSRRL